LVVAPVLVWATTGRALNLDKILGPASRWSRRPSWAPAAVARRNERERTRCFLAVVPLLWAALRCGQRDTATAALILSGFAVWGALAGGGPFAGTALDQSLFPLIMLMIAVSVPSIALSADAALRTRLEAKLRQQEQILRAMLPGRVGVANGRDRAHPSTIGSATVRRPRRNAADGLRSDRSRGSSTCSTCSTAPSRAARASPPRRATSCPTGRGFGSAPTSPPSSITAAACAISWR
jgi:hypothetical protein